MQRGQAPILILVGILILALVAGGAYYFGKSQAPKLQTQIPTLIPSSSPDETANWKTYKNTAYKYLLKYPNDWNIDATKGGEDPTTFSAPSFKSPCQNNGERCARFLLQGPLDANNNIESYFSYNVPGNPDNIASKTEIMVGGEKAIKVEYAKDPYRDPSNPTINPYFLSDQYFPVHVEINIIHNKKIYRILLTEIGQDKKNIRTTKDWKYGQTLDQILSAFRFTQ